MEIVQGIARRADKIAGGGYKIEKSAGPFVAELMRLHMQSPSDHAPKAPSGRAVDEFRQVGSGEWKHDSDHIARTVADVLVRLEWLLPKLSSARRAFFRGQLDIQWPLLSSFARHATAPPPGANPGKTTPSELASLHDFQRDFRSGKTWAHREDVGRYSSIPDDASAWWSLMQHHAGGTRLLDVSTSVLEGLYFACVDWDGTIDPSVDGVLYVLGEGDGRIMVDDATNYDQEEVDETPAKAEEMFDLGHPEIPRFYRGPRTLRNERLKAQRGAFVFWPNSYVPYPLSQHYYVPVDRNAKADIAAELFRFGINPRAVVGGPKGQRAYEQLCSTLKIEPVEHD